MNGEREVYAGAENPSPFILHSYLQASYVITLSGRIFGKGIGRYIESIDIPVATAHGGQLWTLNRGGQPLRGAVK